jgi:hypothetical protein
LEETDLSLQLFAAGWDVYEAGDLRVFHDTNLKHHESAAVNVAAITNTGLFAFLHFPATCCGWGLLSVVNRVIYCVRMELEVFSQGYENWMNRVNVLIIELHDFCRPGTSEAFFRALQCFPSYTMRLVGENLVITRRQFLS